MSAAADTTTAKRVCVDAAEIYERYERPLRRWLGHRVTAPAALVEDACASAWLILVAKRPDCDERIFGWLCTTALREAYRLLREQHREQPRERGEERPMLVPLSRDDPETALEAKRALVALASLRERERRYMAWRAGGYRYREIQELAGGASYTNVNKYLTRARGRLRELAESGGESPVSASEEKRGVPIVGGSCSSCGLRARRVRRCSDEALCERCHRGAIDRVTRRPVLARPPAGRSRMRCISEEALWEAKRLYGLGLSMRAVAETLLEHTGYANAHSAQVALRLQFERHGWPLRTRAEARRTRRAATGEDLVRAA